VNGVGSAFGLGYVFGLAHDYRSSLGDYSPEVRLMIAVVGRYECGIQRERPIALFGNFWTLCLRTVDTGKLMRSPLCLTFALLTYAATCIAAPAARFTVLGQGMALDVSQSGEYVVGWLSSATITRDSFIWSRSTGLTTISAARSLPMTSDPYYAREVANDGTTLITSHLGETHAQAYLWHSNTGIIPLGNGPSRAHELSSDGRTVIGAISDPAYWTAATGWSVLGHLPGAPSHYPQITGTAFARSADGTTLVGRADYNVNQSPEPYTAFRWTASEGMQELGGILPTYNEAVASAVSADGSIVSGLMGDDILTTVFRWTKGSGVQVIGGGLEHPTMSDDGSLIAWTGAGIHLKQARIWTPRNGVRNLQDVLTEAGANLTGWHLATVEGMSADGRTFVGAMVGAGREPYAYVAVLPVPEPGVYLFVTFTIAFIRRRSRG
jgi:hypothetical protein